MGILFGLLSAVFWGTGDYLISLLTRRTGTPRAMVFIQAFSLLSWVVLLLISGQKLPQTTLLGLAIVTGVLHVAGLLLTYRAFEIGTLSLVSPIASGFAVVTALVAFANGERPPVLALGGTALLILGVVVATYTPDTGDASAKKRSLAGVPEALGSALAFGIMFYLFERVEGGMGVLWPLVILKTMAFGSALISVLGAKKPLENAPKSSPTLLFSLALGAAALDTLAWLSYNKGLAENQFVTIVTALASLFSLVTILLAWIFLKDRLTLNQWAGVALVLTGILLVSL